MEALIKSSMKVCFSFNSVDDGFLFSISYLWLCNGARNFTL